MPFVKLRSVGAVLVGTAILVLGVTAYPLWKALQLGQQVTTVGVAINFAPGIVLLVAGAIIIAKPRRTTIAFWIAPLWVPALFWGWAAISLQPTIGFPAIVAIVATFFVYLGMLVVGLPAFLVMRAQKWTGLGAAMLVGAAAGLSLSFFGLLVVLLSRGPEFVRWSALSDAVDPVLLSISTVLGVLVSATFWAIARPDRSSAA